MKSTLRDYLDRVRIKRQKRRRIVAILLVLSLLVSTDVTWGLRKTGIAQAGDAYCGIEEHQHSEECFEQQLTCEQEESEEHVHDEDSCYEEVLSCGLEEHIHDLECYNNPEADVETAAQWEATLPSGLSGTMGENLVAVAESQIGYAESTDNYSLNESDEIKGYSRYGEWYGNPYGDWDAMFVSFCLYYAGIGQDVMPYASGVQTWIAQLSDVGQYADAEYEAKPGDLVFLDTVGDGTADHVGIVTSASDGVIGTIEGDMEDSVQGRSYSSDSAGIIGYGVLSSEEDTDQEEDSDDSQDGEDVDASEDTEDSDQQSEQDGENQDIPEPEAEEETEAEGDVEAEDSEAEPTAEPNAEEAEEEEEEIPEEIPEAAALMKALAIEDEDLPEWLQGKTVNELVVDETSSDSGTGRNAFYYKIVPEYTHSFIMETQNSGDTYGYLYDETGRQLSSNDDGGSGTNFRITYTMNEGQTYYLGVGFYNSTRTGTITTTMTRGTTHNYTIEEDGIARCVCGEEIPRSGICGPEATWRIEGDTLYIEGTGNIQDFTNSTTNTDAWKAYTNLIKNVEIAEGITAIGNYAFLNSKIESISIPDTVVTIGTGAFQNSDGLMEIKLPEGVTAIPNSAFFDCDGLTNVELGSDVTSIGPNAFYSCNNLEDINLPEGLTNIGNSAFSGCIKLTDVTLPDSLEVIGTSAFNNCDGLTEITIPDKVTSISNSAFNDCDKLETVTLGSNVTTIGTYAFSSCDNLEQINLPEGLTNIDNYAFNSSRKLTNVTLPDSLEVLGTNVFYNCDGLTEITIPDKVTNVSNYSFYDCDNLQTVNLGSGVTTIGTYAFYSNDKLEEINFNENLETIGNYAFYYCQKLREVSLPEGVTSIGNYAFQSCNILNEVSLPDSLQSIGAGAFTNCNALSTLEIPEGVETIGSDALPSNLLELTYNAKDAQTINTQPKLSTNAKVTIGTKVDTLPADFVNIVNRTGNLFFEGVNQLTIEEGVLNSSNLPEVLRNLSGEVYVDEQGALYTYDILSGTAELIYCPPNVTSYQVPEQITVEGPLGIDVDCTVTSVGNGALENAKQLKELTFEDPSAITKLGQSAFSNCLTLQTVNGEHYIQDAVKTFDSDAEIPISAFNKTGLIGGSTEEPIDREDPKGSTDFNEIIDGQGSFGVVLGSKGPTLSYVGDEDGAGYYRLLTGDTLNLIISTDTRGSTEFREHRVYLQTTGGDAVQIMEPGESRVYDGLLVTCHETDVPYVYYYSFIPEQGQTISIPFPLIYQSPNSGGGGVRVWTEIPPEDEEDGTYISPEGRETIEAWWDTLTDDYQIAKTASTRIVLAGDGQGGAKIDNSPFTYYIRTTRTVDTSDANATTYGRDIVTSMVYTDTLRLPEGLRWNDTIQQAIRDGNYRYSINGANLYFYAAGEQFAYFNGLNYTPKNVTLSIDEEGHITYSFRMDNTSTTSQMTNGTITANFVSQYVDVDYPTYSQSEEKNIKNDVDLDVNYSYSDPIHRTSGVEYLPTTNPANINVQKSRSGESTFGGDTTYTIALRNPGVAHYYLNKDGGNLESEITTEARISDVLNNTLYITEENMEKMLRDTYGEYLTISIQNATFAADPSTAYDTAYAADGTETAVLHPGNTNVELVTADVTIGWEGDSIVIRRGDEVIPVTGTLEETLHELGFVQTDVKTIYTVSWDQSTYQDGVLYGGEIRNFMIYSSIKDTYQYHIADWNTRYNNNSTNYRRVDNQADYSLGGRTGRSNNPYFYAYSEASISKGSFVGDTSINSSYPLTPGEVITYSIAYSDSKPIKKETLPVIDYMTGSQRLLVPVQENPQLAQYGLTIVEDEEIQYYKLDRPGTYERVWVGTTNNTTLLADVVTIDEDKNAEIRWYLSDLYGRTGSYSRMIRYKAVVDVSDLDSATFSVSNHVSAGGRTGNTINARIPSLNGTVISSDKKIIDPTDGSLSSHSIIYDGDTVTYQLKLHSLSPDGFRVNGSALSDTLPNTMGLFAWEKNTNVRITYEAEEGAQVETSGLDDWTIEAETQNGNTTYRILWPEDSYIQFAEDNEFYFYVELTFPESDLWMDYGTAVGGRILDNTFNCYGFDNVVTHDAAITTIAYLQKGVYSTGRLVGSYNKQMDGDRVTYANKDRNDHFVQYYVTLYNEAGGRLYLSPLRDTLPQGFTYYTMCSNSTARTGNGNINYTYSYSYNGSDLSEFGDGRTVSYPYAQINYSNPNNTGVRFTITMNSDHYDSSRSQYYLNPGEVITFSYLAKTGEAKDTEQEATNTISMDYTDYMGAGVRVSDVEINGKSNAYCEGENDGECKVERVNGTDVLTSDVTVTRGDVIPGITKQTVSTSRHVGGTTVTSNYTGTAQDDATVNWKVRLMNNGLKPIYDYTFTDEMEKPYSFTGDITLSFYTNRDISIATQTVSIDNYADEARTEDGVDITVNNASMHLKIYTNDEGNEVLELKPLDYNLAIPDSGYIDVTLSTVNNTAQRDNKVFTNKAYLTPENVSFDSVSDGRPIPGEDGELKSVETSSPVNVVFGFATSSIKHIHEIEDTSNKTDSTQSTRYIVLSEREKLFRYTLEVATPTDFDLTSFIVIDNLPEVNDHSPYNDSVYRNSEFKVSLAEDPDFEVVVTDRNGDNPVTLDPSQYTIDFNDKTSFTNADWRAETQWDEEPTETTRSIRINVQQTEDYAVAKDSRIKIYFNGKIDDENAKPGQIAWNTFGYHYSVYAGQNIELNAMPLEVGIKIPEIPKLEKKLTYQEGTPYTAKKDEEFTFLIHEGAALADYSQLTPEMFTDKQVAMITLTVEEGATASERITLNQLKLWTMNEDGTWTETEDWFRWIHNTRYTVAEIGISDTFEIRSMNKVRKNSYTFTYLQSQSRTITAENMTELWDLNITKTEKNKADVFLKDAKFALYSRIPADEMTDEDYEALTDTVERTREIQGETWYLARVGITDENGKLTWAELNRAVYYMEEYEAPAGYNLPEQGWTYYRSDSRGGISDATVENETGRRLPRTGGMGTAPWRMMGMLLMAAAVICGYGTGFRRRRRGER